MKLTNKKVRVSRDGEYYCLYGKQKHKLIKTKCLNCGNECLIRIRKKEYRNYCSNKCKFAWNRREKHYLWRGGIRHTSRGYIEILMPEHPRSDNKGYVKEHIFVMEKKLGRPLEKGENVHHKNGKKDDNRQENLELWLISQPYGQRVEDKIKWAKEILKKYEGKNY